MKRLVALILAAVMLCCLSACGETKQPVEEVQVPAETPVPKEQFIFRGIPLTSSYDEIKNNEGNNIAFESNIILRVTNVDLGVVTANMLEYYFDENDTQMPNYAIYNIYKNGGSKVDKDIENAIDAYDRINSLLSSKYGTPLYTKADRDRPLFNNLDGNPLHLMEGSAYKPEAFAGSIESYSEWLIEDGDNWVDVAVYQKYYPAHMYREVSVMYTPVSNSVLEGISDAYNDAIGNI